MRWGCANFSFVEPVWPINSVASLGRLNPEEQHSQRFEHGFDRSLALLHYSG